MRRAAAGTGGEAGVGQHTCLGAAGSDPLSRILSA